MGLGTRIALRERSILHRLLREAGTINAAASGSETGTWSRRAAGHR